MSGLAWRSVSCTVRTSAFFSVIKKEDREKRRMWKQNRFGSSPTQVIGDQHVAHPRRPAVGLDGSKNPIFWFRVHAFLPPSPKPFRQQRSHCNRGFRSLRFWLVDVSPDPAAADIDLRVLIINVAPLEPESFGDPERGNCHEKDQGPFQYRHQVQDCEGLLRN